MVFYSISDRLNTTVRSGIEASTFSIIRQLSTVFMIFAGASLLSEKVPASRVEKIKGN